MPVSVNFVGIATTCGLVKSIGDAVDGVPEPGDAVGQKGPVGDDGAVERTAVIGTEGFEAALE